MSESSRTSGVFIQPRWKSAPGTVEKVVSMVMTVMALGAFFLCTILVANGAPEIKAAAEAFKKSAKAMKPPLDGTLAATRPAEGAGERYAQGRQVMAEKTASLGKELKADHRFGQYLPWVIVGLLALIGVIFCFFGWQVRRVTSALYGALTLGGVTFLFGWLADMGIIGSILVALPPAFLGALIGWYLIVISTCIQVGELLSIPVIVLLALAYSKGQPPLWLLPVTISVWAAMTALTYLFLVRAALISLMSLVGAVCLTSAAIVALVALKDVTLPWEAALAIVAFFAVVGNLTQYRYAGGAKAEGDDDDDGDNPYDYRPPARKKLKLKPA